MAKLSMYLPPCSADYSGVCSAMYNLACLTVINDASCCTSHFVFYDEPRWEKRPAKVFSTGLRSTDAILGCEDKLVKTVCQAASNLAAERIVLVGTPVPAIIGMDMVGIANEIESKTGIETYGFNTTGFAYYDRGLVMAGMALIDRHAEKSAKKQKNKLNILGVSPLDFGDIGNAEDLENALTSSGWGVNCCLFEDQDTEKIRRIGEAGVNLAVSSSGVKLAKYLEKKFGTPYVAAVPTGRAHFEEALSQLNGEKVEIPEFSENPSVLIVSDQVAGNSLRSALRLSGCEAAVRVCSFFGWDESLAKGSDAFLGSEADLIHLLRSGRYGTIIADPMIWNIPETANLRKCEFVHPAVSGKLHWDKVPQFLSLDPEKLSVLT